jgi:hypothetical protein
MNTIELVGKTQDNKIECAVRSDAERDLHGVIDDPYAHIMGIATLMGYTPSRIRRPTRHRRRRC